MEKRIDPVTGEEVMEPTTLKEITESIIELRRALHQTVQEREKEEKERKEEEKKRKEKERKEEERKRKEEEKKRKEEEKKRKEEEKERKEEEKKQKEEQRLKDEEWRKQEKEHWREIDRKIDKFFGQFTTDWGKLLEEVTKPAAVKLFKEIGIDIDHIFQESRHREEHRREMEADIILVNTTAVVVVEVKTTLRKDDVDHFLKQMELFKDLFREFKDKTVYVAVAAVKFNNSSDVYARKKGVFVLRSNGEAIFGLDNVPEEQRRRY